MPNDMMLAALQKQRATKMDPQPIPAKSATSDDESSLAARIDELEQKLEVVCKLMGIEESTGKSGDDENSGKMEKY